MKHIPLTKGFSTIVDDKDYEWLSGHKWHVEGQSHYAARRTYNKDGSSKMLYMHREIMKTKRGMDVDHINGDPRDNRRSNLRNCSRRENMLNKIGKKNGTSKYKGVSWNKLALKWQVYISLKGKNKFLGCYEDQETGAKAYDKAAKKNYREYAKLNFV